MCECKCSNCTKVEEQEKIIEGLSEQILDLQNNQRSARLDYELERAARDYEEMIHAN